MALLANNAPAGPLAGRLRALLQSRLVLGVGYGVASALTIVSIILVASPPATGPLGTLSKTILFVVLFNLLLIFALMGVLSLRIIDLLNSGDAGARLHVRFARLFALAAVAPAAVVFLFSGVLVNVGVDNWFSDRVRTVTEASATVLRSYIDDQTQYMVDHVTPMALDLNREAGGLQAQPQSAASFLEALASLHAFAAAYLVNGEGQVIAKAESSKAPAYVAPTRANLAAANRVIYVPDFGGRDVMRALYRLDSFPDTYLYVARPLQPGIINYLREAENRLVSYRDVAKHRHRIQTIFFLSYSETALLVLVGAVWLGLAAAGAISTPIARLVQAAGRVAGGDLSVRIDAEADPDEIAVLSRAFNGMTHDLQAQQEALRRASDEAEERRQFIETVLAEVSAGVIGLDGEGRISVANRQAAQLLALPGDHGRGRMLAEVAPEFASLAAGDDSEQEVDVVRGRDARRLRVRAGDSEGGRVLTFDDVTRLVAAQRNAAWRDVARRIAHEIKNPLTPIQLSSERLRKKYRKDIAPAELEIFDRCTETIERNVGDIGRMVDEFSAFARMPAPKYERLDAAELLRASVFAQRVAAPDISVELEDPKGPVDIRADSRMLGQALTNVLKNATEAVEARRSSSPQLKGRILARLIQDDGALTFEVEDNGVGLPAKDRDRLTEPYVTTREKGTGLGLAIVKRILEDHGGELELTDARGGQGALAILRLPMTPVARRETPAETVSA